MPPLAVDGAGAAIPSEAHTILPSRLAAVALNSFSCKPPWSASKSAFLYRLHQWGAPYFTVNAEGNMSARPFGMETKLSEEIDIMQVLQTVVNGKLFGAELCHLSPLIVRFPDILKHRLEMLQSAFDSSIKALHYHGRYQGVFPVKCNQDRFVVENIVEFGEPCAFGLEAGSKPELLLAMSSLCSKGSPDALLVCNGYKDAEYVSLALIAMKLKLKCVIVLEQEEELDLVLSMSRKLRVEPRIGLRAKLNTKHEGHFGATSGENGKFGLSCAQIVRIVHELQRKEMVHCLQLLHFHIGSQIPTLTILHDGVSEAAHIYCELSLMGANMQYIDIGGGLGVDYDGSSSAESDMSVGYTVEEYAKEVVLAVKSACGMKKVKQPTLCSESGRALVSHHSVLVFDVLSAEKKGAHMAGDEGVSLEVDGALPQEIHSLRNAMAASVRIGDYEGAWEHAKQIKLSCIELFKKGEVSLMQLASVSKLYELVMEIAEETRYEMVVGSGKRPLLCSTEISGYGGRQVLHRESSHNAVYRINLSIFRSMPDAWAIGQLFPIVPLHRLGEEPTVRAILSDLTCDSDGKITSFVGTGTEGSRAAHMKVHPLQEGEPYYMGMFLGGAYQEALGSMHNLFGGPPVIQVVQHAGKGGAAMEVIKVSDGENSCEVLRSMQYEPMAMLESLCSEVKKRFEDGDTEGKTETMRAIARSLFSSTYLACNNRASSSPANIRLQATDGE